jgi:hypothetical protein
LPPAPPANSPLQKVIDNYANSVRMLTKEEFSQEGSVEEDFDTLGARPDIMLSNI